MFISFFNRGRPVEDVDARVAFMGVETDSYQESDNGPMPVLGALMQAVKRFEKLDDQRSSRRLILGFVPRANFGFVPRANLTHTSSASTKISRADPPHAPISRRGLKAVSLAACLSDTAHIIHIRSA